jgi:simple sugar transport system ATP-binding protein
MARGPRPVSATPRPEHWESTAVLNAPHNEARDVVQTRNVLDLIKRVRDHGLSVVLISHNMPEVFEVADRIEVLRLGKRVARMRPSEVSMEDIVAAMTGAATFHEENGR